MAPPNFQALPNFIWSVADLLRGPYRQPQYERVMLPMTVLRRFDCVLEHSKKQILAKHQAMEAKNKTLPAAKRINDFDPTLNKLAKDADGRALGFHNHSPLNFQKLKGDPDNVGRHLLDYINGFSKNIREIFDKFEFDKEIEKMEDSNRLYLVVSKFAEIDLHPKDDAHPNGVDNISMGLVFEDLIRRFNESANETAGDHFTPREVIRLMVDLLMEPDGDILTNGSPIVTNRKTKKRKRKIHLIDCRERYRPMPRSLGDKRRYLDQKIIDALSREHGAFKESETSKITKSDPKAAPVIAKLSAFPKLDTAILFPNQTLPKNLTPAELQHICGYFPETKGKKGKAVVYEADPKLRDNENVPLNEDIVSFFLREVRPFVANAWINGDPKLRDEKDDGIGKVGYEINFNQYSLSAAQPELSVETIASQKIGVPSVPEQQRIASHLNSETARIDALVAEKEMMLVLLEQKRSALITAAVTGRINPATLPA